MDQRKRELLESDEEQQYVTVDNVEEVKEQAAKTARQQQRDEIIQKLDAVPELTHKQLADIFDLSASRVSQIVNAR